VCTLSFLNSFTLHNSRGFVSAIENSSAQVKRHRKHCDLKVATSTLERKHCSPENLLLSNALSRTCPLRAWAFLRRVDIFRVSHVFFLLRMRATNGSCHFCATLRRRYWDPSCHARTKEAKTGQKSCTPCISFPFHWILLLLIG
jgi:hypothetical protein